MKIVYISSECAPFVKTGGLGDVAGALPEALCEYKGNEVAVFLPYYSKIKNDSSVMCELVGEFETDLAWRRSYIGLYRYKSRRRKLSVYFIDNGYYFDRENIYGYYDDGERFAYFNKAVLESLCYLGISPDIIHCNDWQSALVPALLHSYYNETLGSAKTVFTIHNIEYQGWADPYFLGDVLGLGEKYISTFTYNGSLNFVKGAVLSCDALTTVSRTYAEEICHPYFAHGLCAVMRDHAFKTVGIVNGIDVKTYDSAADKFIAKNYSFANVSEGKAECKRALQESLGLPVREDTALVGIVSRLVEHKGMDIICDAIDEMMDMDIQFVILGTGDEYYEKKLSDAAEKYPEKLSLNLKFNGAMASEIYAASDIYLMPSKSEPCGLSQLIAMRYGAIPVVHETGGLKDTVVPFNEQTNGGMGFSFSRFDKEDMLDALRRALDVYYGKKEAWGILINNAMSSDYSWKKPAGEYMRLYENLLERER